MAELNETPRGNRIHIAFFGLRNAGKSTLVNAFAGQPVAIVSDVPGTTTDPVSKAMEILPLGPCLITDTAGLDDVGELGEQRVRKTLDVLETTDIAVWVDGLDETAENAEKRKDFLIACRQRNVTVLEFHRGDSVEELKRKIAAVRIGEKSPGLLDGLVREGDRVLCVCPIDESAPKGRLILPQVQVIRECLDRHVAVTVCQPEELRGLFDCSDCSDCSIVGLSGRNGRLLVITDSQAFGKANDAVSRWNAAIEQSNNPNNRTIRLTSFSILFARQKGDLAEYAKGLKAIGNLKDGDTVLVAEGCTHHRQCNDIGTVKIPKALEKLSGRKLKFEFASGAAFAIEQSNNRTIEQFSLVVHCGGCMLTRREMLRRIGLAKEAGVPIVNYGLLLAAASGIDVGRLVQPLTANN